MLIPNMVYLPWFWRRIEYILRKVDFKLFQLSGPLQNLVFLWPGHHGRQKTNCVSSITHFDSHTAQNPCYWFLMVFPDTTTMGASFIIESLFIPYYCVTTCLHNHNVISVINLHNYFCKRLLLCDLRRFMPLPPCFLLRVRTSHFTRLTDASVLRITT